MRHQLHYVQKIKIYITVKGWTVVPAVPVNGTGTLKQQAASYHGEGSSARRPNKSPISREDEGGLVFI